MFGLDSFKSSTLGERVGAVIDNPQAIGDMVVFSRHQMPAVQAIGKQLAALGPEVRQDQVKKTIGRWVREILEHQGFTVWKKRRVAPGNLFSTGMVYRPTAQSAGNRHGARPKAQLSPAQRAAAWREAVHGLPHTKPLPDEAIGREVLYSERG
ncbi:MAG TPA: hypothetical protein VFC56_06575 [Stellaceae bacterium]|nr:hypothetical protein [Stellaceae bacterium]